MLGDVGRFAGVAAHTLATFYQLEWCGDEKVRTLERFGADKLCNLEWFGVRA